MNEIRDINISRAADIMKAWPEWKREYKLTKFFETDQNGESRGSSAPAERELKPTETQTTRSVQR
jgi:hypothetical protein